MVFTVIFLGIVVPFAAMLLNHWSPLAYHVFVAPSTSPRAYVILYTIGVCDPLVSLLHTSHSVSLASLYLYDRMLSRGSYSPEPATAGF